MTSVHSGNLAVILSKPEYLDWLVLGKALAAIRKIPLQDAAHQAKVCWGIIEENITEEESVPVLDGLGAAGLGGIAMETAKLAAPRTPHPVKHIRLDAKGLDVETKPADFRLIPWDFISLAAVSVFKRSTIKTIKIQEGPSATEKLVKTGILLSTGIPLPMTKKRTVEKTVGDSELFFFMDIFLKQNGLRMRLDAQTLDYSFLKERKEFGAHVNFRLLVQEVVKNATGALFNRGVRVLMGSQPLNTIGYETAADFEKECRWLLTLASQ